MLLDLTDDDIVTVIQRIEGWITGLKMGALSLQNESDRHAVVLAFSGMLEDPPSHVTHSGLHVSLPGEQSGQ